MCDYLLLLLSCVQPFAIHQTSIGSLSFTAIVIHIHRTHTLAHTFANYVWSLVNVAFLFVFVRARIFLFYSLLVCAALFLPLFFPRAISPSCDRSLGIFAKEFVYVAFNQKHQTYYLPRKHSLLTDTTMASSKWAYIVNGLEWLSYSVQTVDKKRSSLWMLHTKLDNNFVVYVRNTNVPHLCLFVSYASSSCFSVLRVFSVRCFSSHLLFL